MSGAFLSNPLRSDGLRDHDEAMLQAPADEDLRGGPPVLCGDFRDHRVLEAASSGERAVCLQLDAMLLTILEEVTLVQERMEFDLLHRRRNRRGRQELLQVRNGIIAHAD